MTEVALPLNILKIALDVPLDGVFDYHANGIAVEVGQRVVVPFGRRKQVGIVVAKAAESDIPVDKLKSIISAFSDETPLDQETFGLMRFCADYYQYPFGQALLSALPARLRQTEPAQGRKQYAYVLTDIGAQVSTDDIAPKQLVQRKLLAYLQEHGESTDTALSEVSATWRKAMQVFIDQAWVSSREIYAGLDDNQTEMIPLAELNPDQAGAVSQVLLEPNVFKPWLLHGITGSGKTEVYMQLIHYILSKQSGQVLVLVPEINLTPQLEARFRSRLPDFPLVSLHSNLGESERLQNWRLAQSGKARIVIGTRLAVFTPLPELRMVIVDEEHDTSYKQQDGMRYHARDIALVRAQRAKVPIVLGSATPALETWHNAVSGRYGHLTLGHRAVAKARLPEISCINVAGGLQDGLSPTLIEAMRERLKKGEQSLLFINRRGYSPVLLCNACHWIAPCMRCSSRLVVHLRQGRLRCHHCGHEQKIAPQCPSCGNPDLHPTGHGTQRLEQTLSEIFPDARILRVDRDSTRRKDALNEMLTAVHASEVDILVGTQMLAKGHDFPNLTLVGVIDTDSALFSPDFRAAERLFAQLMQVAGRAGRADKAGEVLIQTTFPDHPLFHALRAQDYAAYATTLMEEREMTQFPPYAFLAVIKAESNDFSEVQRFLKHAANEARAYQSDVMIYDPVRPQMERLKGMERAQLLLQASSRQALQVLLRHWIPSLRASKLGAKVRWAVDVDPQEF